MIAGPIEQQVIVKRKHLRKSSEECSSNDELRGSDVAGPARVRRSNRRDQRVFQNLLIRCNLLSHGFVGTVGHRHGLGAKQLMHHLLEVIGLKMIEQASKDFVARAKIGLLEQVGVIENIRIPRLREAVRY